MHRGSPIVSTSVGHYIEYVNSFFPKSRIRSKAAFERFARQRVSNSSPVLIQNLRTQHIVRRHFEEFVLQMRLQPLTTNTIKSYLSQLRGYMTWIQSHGWHRSGAAIVPVLPPSGPRPIECLSEAQLGVAYQAVHGILDHPRFPGRQAELFLRLQADCGLRCAEAFWLSKYEMQKGYLALSPHYGRELKTARAARTVPLPAHVEALLCDAFSDGRLYLFEAANTLPHPTRNPPWASLRTRLARRLPFDFTMQMLRRTFATRAAAHGIVPDQLQALMGHADIATTFRFYVKPSTPKAFALPWIA